MCLTEEKKTLCREKLILYLHEYKIKPGSKILIAFSGGPDSTALLHIMNQLKKEWNFQLFAAYLNHGLRDEAEVENEIKQVKKITKMQNIELFIENIEYHHIKRQAKDRAASLEGVARERRYSFLNMIAGRLKVDYIALGHNLDDQMETLIMRFFQGSSIFGLTGIPHLRGIFIRPLINCTREEIFSYLKYSKLNYVVDSTNLHKRYLRNSIRLDLIPMIKSIFPGFRKSLAVFTEKMIPVKSYIETQAEKKFTWQVVERGFRIRADKYIKADKILRLSSFYAQYNKVINAPLKRHAYRLPYRFVKPLLDDLYIEKQGTLLCGYGIKLIRRQDYLFLEREVVLPRKKGYFISVKREKVCKIKPIGIEVIIGAKRDFKNKEAYAFLDQERVKEPLAIRSRKPGDKIIAGFGRKSLKKLYQEWGIPRADRWKIPVLEDRDGIVYIFGAILGYKDRYRSGVKLAGKLDKSAIPVIINKME